MKVSTVRVLFFYVYTKGPILIPFQLKRYLLLHFVPQGITYHTHESMNELKYLNEIIN